MIRFTDSKDRVWRLKLDLGKAEIIQSNLGFDFLSDKAEAILTDLELCINVIFCVLEEQAEAKGLSDIAFGKFLKQSNNAELFRSALLDSWAEFSLKPADLESLPAQKKAKAEEPEADHWRHVWELAGSLGIGDPRHLTYRQLFLMAKGKRQATDNTLWEPASLIACLLSRQAGNRQSKQADFLPERLKPKPKPFWED